MTTNALPILVPDGSKAPKLAQRRLMLRQQLWPEVSQREIWNRKEAKGFATIPRTLPLIYLIMDRCSVSKPVSSTYFDLWTRAFDEGFIECNNIQEMAFSAGFTTSRKVHIWAERIGILEKLGFILVAPGSYGPRSFILLRNPYNAVNELRAKGEVHDDFWNALLGRVSQIGAKDLELLPPQPPRAQTTS